MLDDRPEVAHPPGGLGPVPYELRWTCRVCKKTYVIPPFARDCELEDARRLGLNLEEFLAQNL